MNDFDWIKKAVASFTGYYGLPPGLASAAATALLGREKSMGRFESDPEQVVMAHMDSPEPPIVDPDAEYGDGLTIRLGTA